MVRPSGALLVFLPEPPGWRAHPRESRLPEGSTAPCWCFERATALGDLRVLAVVEIVDYNLFSLGTSRVLELDPEGVIAERLGDEAAERVRRSLRDSRTYPTFSVAGGALHRSIFGDDAPAWWVFEALVRPNAYASSTLWDARLLGQRQWIERYGARELEMGTSPGLACCNVDVLHPGARLSAAARVVKPTAVRVGELAPLIRREQSDREAESALHQIVGKFDDRKRSRAAQGDSQQAPPPKYARGWLPSVAPPPPKPAAMRGQAAFKGAAKLRVGHTVFLRPDRLPMGTSPHQPHLILAETWPLRGERGGAPRHLRLQPQPSGEPLLLEEGAARPLAVGFREEWVAMGAGMGEREEGWVVAPRGRRSTQREEREALLRAAAWFCAEYSFRPAAENIRQLLPSGAVSKAEARELAAEMEALAGGSSGGYASGADDADGARAARAEVICRSSARESTAGAARRRPAGATSSTRCGLQGADEERFVVGTLWFVDRILPCPMSLHRVLAGGKSREGAAGRWVEVRPYTAEGMGEPEGAHTSELIAVDREGLEAARCRAERRTGARELLGAFDAAREWLERAERRGRETESESRELGREL